MTSDRLKQERLRRDFTQERMAEHLASTPVSTYRKWEQGVRKVPAWVDAQLAPRQMAVPGLTMAEINDLDRLARERGLTLEQLVGEFIRTGLKGGAAS